MVFGHEIAEFLHGFLFVGKQDADAELAEEMIRDDDGEEAADAGGNRGDRVDEVAVGVGDSFDRDVICEAGSCEHNGRDDGLVALRENSFGSVEHVAQDFCEKYDN